MRDNRLYPKPALRRLKTAVKKGKITLVPFAGTNPIRFRGSRINGLSPIYHRDKYWALRQERFQYKKLPGNYNLFITSFIHLKRSRSSSRIFSGYTAAANYKKIKLKLIISGQLPMFSVGVPYYGILRKNIWLFIGLIDCFLHQEKK